MIQEDDCRPLLDEAEYETLIGIARTHCGDIVPYNREAKTGFLVFAIRSPRKATCGETCGCLRFTRTITVLVIQNPLGGNVTGITSNWDDLSGKRLELLKETIPTLSLVAVLWNSTA